MIGQIRIRDIALIIAAAIAAAAICFAAASSLGDWPPYRAQATLIIDETPDTAQAGITAEGITIAQTTMAALIQREPLTSEVAAALDIGLDADSLVDHLQVNLPEGAPIVEVSASHGDPETAALIANTTAAAAAEIRSPLTGATVLSEAEVPTSPTLSAYLIVGAAGVVGALIAIGGLLVGRSMSDRLETLDQVKECTSLPVIGHVRLQTADPAQEVNDRVLLSALARRLRNHDLDVLFTSPTPAPSQLRLVELQSAVLSGRNLNGHQPEVLLVEELEVTPSAVSNGSRSPEPEEKAEGDEKAAEGDEGEAELDEPNAEGDESGSDADEKGADDGSTGDWANGEPPRRAKSARSRSKASRAGKAVKTKERTKGAKADAAEEPSADADGDSDSGGDTADAGSDPKDSGKGDDTNGGDKTKTGSGTGDETSLPNQAVTADQWLAAIGSDSRPIDGDVSIIVGPPVLSDPSILSRLNSNVRVVLLAERRVTRGPDLEVASNAIIEAGAEHPAVLFIG